MKLLKVIWFWSVLGMSSVYASNAIFEEANSAYKDGDFEQAVDKYKLILAKDPSIAEVNYNLATSYYQLNQLGESILYFEKTLKWDPGNRAAKHNLQLAYLKSDHEIEPLPQLFFIEWWQQLISFKSASTWAKWAVLFAWLSLAFFIGNIRSQRKVFKRLGIFTVITCLCMAFLAFQKHKFNAQHNYAIVLSKEAPTRETPNQNADQVVMAHEGLKVELLDSVDQWTQVKLQDETEVWIKSSSLAKI